MLQQQLQLQNQLPIDDMNMAETPVKSAGGESNSSNSERFEQALHQSKHHQKTAERPEPAERGAAKNARTEEQSNGSKETLATKEQEDTPEDTPEAAPIKAADKSKDGSDSTVNEDSKSAETASSSDEHCDCHEHDPSNSKTQGQETAAEKQVSESIALTEQKIQALLSELSKTTDPEQWQTKLTEMTEQVNKLTQRLNQSDLQQHTPELVKLEMVLNKVTEVLAEIPSDKPEVAEIAQNIEQQVSQLVQQLTADLSSKSAALDSIAENIELDNQHAQWLASITAMMKGDQGESEKAPQENPETKLEQAHGDLKLQVLKEPVKMDMQQLSSSQFEIKVDAEQLKLNEKVVFEPLSHSLLQQAKLKNDDGKSVAVDQLPQGKINLTEAKEVSPKDIAEAEKSDNVADKKPQSLEGLTIPKVASQSESNTTAQALAQLTAGSQNKAMNETMSAEIVNQTLSTSNDFSREKFLSELTQSPALMRSMQANPVNLEIDTPMVKSQVEVQGVQLDKTLVQPKLDSIQNAKQEGMIRENILFNKNELAANMQTQVGLMLARNMKSVDIRLDPPELGSIQVRLSVSNEQAAVSFVVSTQQAKDALEGSMSKLKELLEQEGLNLADTDVKQENGGKEQNGEGEGDSQHAGGQNGDEEGIEMTDPVLAEKIRQINSPWNVDFYA